MTPRSSGLRIARGKAAAVDHEAVERAGLHLAVEADAAAGRDDLLMQLRQHAARLDMAFAGKEQRVAEAAFERGLDRGERRRIDPLVTGGESRKALEIIAVARMRHHQRAVERRIGQVLAPEVQRAQAEPGNDGLGGLALAPRREHAAGPMAGGEHQVGVALLVQRDVVAGLREQQRLPGAGNACADDGDGGLPA